MDDIKGESKKMKSRKMEDFQQNGCFNNRRNRKKCPFDLNKRTFTKSFILTILPSSSNPYILFQHPLFLLLYSPFIMSCSNVEAKQRVLVATPSCFITFKYFPSCSCSYHFIVVVLLVLFVFASNKYI